MKAFTDHNAPFYIALQVVPSLCEGFVGEGKTSIGLCLARALKRRPVLFNANQHSPEDIGGFPSPDNREGVVKMLPPYWYSDLKEPGGFFFGDEVTTTTPAQRAPLLSLITERKVGQYYVHPDTLFVCAMNPPDLAPNGSPLEPAVANRFYHWKWKMDEAAWLEGLMNPDAPLNWAAPEFPIVPSDWQEYLLKWATVVGEFLRNHGSAYTSMPRHGELAFASYRTWTMAVKCLAAAEAAGGEMFTNNSLVRAMVAGNVGETLANQFVQYKQERDLVDVEELLDGTAKFKHNPNRPDITLCVAAAVTSVIGDQKKFTPDRWDAAAAIIGQIGTECSPEIALKYNRRLRDAAIKAKYAPSRTALKPLQDLMAAVDGILAAGGAK
jgi:MoxR-like ATPase